MTPATTHQRIETRIDRGFAIHAAVFAVVNAGLIALNQSRNPQQHWALWVAGGWAIGLAGHALLAFAPAMRHRAEERIGDRLERRASRQERRDARREVRQ
jgi:hypothetical protein